MHVIAVVDDERDDMKSSSEAQTARSLDGAVEKVSAYLISIRSLTR